MMSPTNPSARSVSISRAIVSHAVCSPVRSTGSLRCDLAAPVERFPVLELQHDERFRIEAPLRSLPHDDADPIAAGAIGRLTDAVEPGEQRLRRRRALAAFLELIGEHRRQRVGAVALAGHRDPLRPETTREPALVGFPAFVAHQPSTIRTFMPGTAWKPSGSRVR